MEKITSVDIASGLDAVFKQSILKGKVSRLHFASLILFFFYKFKYEVTETIQI